MLISNAPGQEVVLDTAGPYLARKSYAATAVDTTVRRFGIPTTPTGESYGAAIGNTAREKGAAHPR